MTDGFPELTDSFLAGQDILYAQFNDVEFYVEDIEQEHFYFNILKGLFPKLKFEKIFPLNGKDNVIDAAKNNLTNRKKIYLVDLDFDHILGRVENVANLFYLRKYSIENYLLTKQAIYEIIRSKNPQLKNYDIDNLVDFNKLLTDSVHCLKELACSFVVIQQRQLGHHYYGLDVNRDFAFHVSPPTRRQNFIQNYLTEVEAKLKSIDNRFTLNSQIRRLQIYFKRFADAISNIPGKYILTFIKERLQSMKLINQMTVETFIYSLSKDFDNNQLKYLQTIVTNYIV